MRKTIYGYEHGLVPQSLNVLRRVLQEEGKTAEAETTVLQALEDARKIVTNNPAVLEKYFVEAAAALAFNKKYAQAELLRREALASARRFATNDPWRLVCRTADLCSVLRGQSKHAEVELLLREADASVHQSAASDPSRLESWSGDLGCALRDQKKFAEAEPHFREALATARQFAARDPSRMDFRLADVGDVLRAQGKYAEAETFFREAAASARQFATNDPARLEVRINDLADVLQHQGKLTEVASLRREELALKRKLGQDQASVTSALNNLAGILLAQHKDAEAEQLFAEPLTPGSEGRPDHTAFLRLRSSFLASRGRWKEAAADTSKLIELEPSDHTLYHALAPLLVQSGDLPGYRRHCAQELAHFAGTSDPNTAERMAKDCLILPDSGVDLSAVSAWADTAITRGKDSGDLPWFQFCKGLAEYRQGRFAGAVDGMQQVLSHSGADFNRDVEVCMVLAMAQYRSKQAGEANAALTKGVEIAEKKLPKLDSGDLSVGWLDWIIAHALMREAKALIQGEADPASNQSTEK